METLEEINRKHHKRNEFKALIRELSQKREAGEITSDEMVKRLDDFEKTL